MAKTRVLMVGTGEYTTGYVPDAAARSDKRAGVVALTLFDLRRRGLVDTLRIAGTNGTKFPHIRRHIQTSIGDVYRDLDTSWESFPRDDVQHDPRAYQAALAEMSPGDVVTVFTPDDTHFPIAMDAVRHGCHVLVAKPLVKTLRQHNLLAKAAAEQGVLVAMEVHKRWDPIYADARDRIRSLGDFSFFHSYMSQPKTQLDTFRAWAGRASDISYYLNAHHIDFHVWSAGSFARPKTVYAAASTGHAHKRGLETEDTITLTVTWENPASLSRGTAVYTASWIAPPSDVHSQQRFFYMGHGGELQVDQAHRGYSLARDASGYTSPNPLFMKYEPDADGYFAGQHGYGYRSIEDFLRAVQALREGREMHAGALDKLATVDKTRWVTAILEAGRRSLDEGGSLQHLHYDADGQIDLG